MAEEHFIPYHQEERSDKELLQRSRAFYAQMNRRRSLRFFSDRPIEKAVIEQLILTASSAPSGAHKQPWTFCAISDSQVKSVIRQAAEKEEFTNYNGRMSEEWLKI